jgi:hypothetical protein
MALLAESLVEEWLNRDGCFTIRGVKHGVREMDLLAVKREPSGQIIGRHFEVQVSFRPIGYICKLTDEIVGTSGRKKTSIRTRSDGEIEACAREWVAQKFSSPKKSKVREQLWPGLVWTYHLVHGVVKYEKEVEGIRKLDVGTIPFIRILLELCHTGEQGLSASAGGDLAEVVRYYRDHCPLNEYQ